MAWEPERRAAEIEHSSRSFADIVRGNVFTRFNALLAALLFITLVVGPPQDALFGIILLINTAVGIGQELRAKIALDRLSVLTAPTARRLVGKVLTEVPAGDVRVGDILRITRGDQVLADGVVLESDGVRLDESLVTGEADAVLKRAGDRVLSGSFVVGGTATLQADAVGEEAYAGRLAAQARRFRLSRSELRAGINRFLAGVAWVLPPLGILLVVSQWRSHPDVVGAVRGSVAGILTLVPEGLVLLTSFSLALAVLRLARRRVLAQDLAAVEVLARVDVVCTDKTGTLTERTPEFRGIELLPGAPAAAESALGALAALERDSSPSLAAIAAAVSDPGWRARSHTPFSSTAGWSEADFAELGRWRLGAPDRTGGEALRRADVLSKTGARVLLLSHSEEPAALVVLRERVRADAAETIGYFQREGVDVEVLSGDSQVTAAAVADAVGLKRSAAHGRVDPEAKRRYVAGLRAQGHVVAMIGDGVNDIPALKEADIGIAMAGGSGAARAVAQLVLAGGGFAALPTAVAEGRRVIANTERLSGLYFTKTVYAGLLGLAVALASEPFPFLPRQLTLIGAFTIGIPSFFLAFAPNRERARPGFLRRSLLLAVPAGLIAGGATYLAYSLALDEPGVSATGASTIAVLVLMALGLWLLSILLRPLTRARRVLLGGLTAGAAAVISLEPARRQLALEFPSALVLLAGLGVVVLGVGAMELSARGARLLGSATGPLPRAAPSASESSFSSRGERPLP